ncbi:MAG: hypothetical protein FWC45_09245 [Treponema sp.]|nr:hypothetical protein [Treponema sp.]
MIYKRLGVVAVLFVLLAFPASASMVSFLLVETGLSEDVPSREYTSLWEGGLMAAFFDAGHIVTNSPIARMKAKPSVDLTGLVKDDFNDAINGGADYFLLGFVEYKIQDAKVVPVGIVLKLFNINSQKLLHEQRFPGGVGKNLEEEYQIAQNAGWEMVSHLKDR